MKQSQYLLSRLALLCLGASTFAARGQSTITSFEDPINVQQDVFYRGIDQNIYFRYYNSAQGWQQQNLTTLAGAPLAALGSVVTSFEDTVQNQQHVIFQAINGDLYHLYSTANATSWQVEDLSASVGGNTAAPATPLLSYADNVNDVQYVFYVGSNLDVNAYYWHNGWFALDASAVAGAVPSAPGSKLTGYFDNYANLEHVFYQGADLHIHELYSGTDPAQIAQNDVTTASGAPPVMLGSGLAGTFNSAAQQEDLYFEDAAQHLQHLSFTYGVGNWASEDLTSYGGALPVLYSSVSAFQDAITGKQHVMYIGVDGHVHQYFASAPWQPGDLTLEAGTLNLAQTLPLSSFKDDPDAQQHVFYVGADLHFYHLWYSDQWNSQDITSGAIPAY